MSNLPKYEDLLIKKYYIIRFNFQKDFSRYEVFEYEAKKRKTIKQMWQFVYFNENAFIYFGSAKHIMQYFDIIEKYNLPENRCYRLMTFGNI